MSSEKFRIDYPMNKSAMAQWCAEYGLNSIYKGKHWAKRKKDADYWHILTQNAMRKANCRSTPFKRPVLITFRWNDNLDLSNHAYIAKMIEDAMKGCIIKDDSKEYVHGICHYFHDEPYIAVTVCEIGDIHGAAEK